MNSAILQVSELIHFHLYKWLIFISLICPYVIIKDGKLTGFEHVSFVLMLLMLEGILQISSD